MPSAAAPRNDANFALRTPYFARSFSEENTIIMANRHPSAIKRARQNIKLNDHNTTLRSALRTAVKKVVTAVEKGDAETARIELPLAVRALGKAKTKGIIHSNQASRKISRLTRKVAKLDTTPS